MLSRFFKIRNWNILSKIVGINLIILLVSFFSIYFYIIPVYEASLQNKQKSFTENLVDMSLSFMRQQYAQAEAGKISKDEAQRRAIENVRVMANGNDYLWIHDLNLVMIAHPHVPQMENKQLAGFRDPTGKHIFVEMNDLVQQKGAGFYEYTWPKPSDGSAASKISCVKLFQPWGWVVGSGMYYDDIHRETAEIRSRVMMVTSILLAAIISFSLYAARRINQPLKNALKITHHISGSHLAEASPLETSDEPKLLLHAIEGMVTELKNARDEAVQANSAKSDFLARMSHDIRTPMNAVIGMTELAMESAPTLEQKEYLEGVRSSAEHLMELINDILDFSKAEAGRLTLERISFGLRDTIAASLRPLIFRARQKGIECAANIADDVPDTLVGDPVRLRQVITNLVGNAIKFTEAGQVTLEATVVSLDAEGLLLGVHVRDTGIGVPADVADSIFEPFTQADSSTTRKFGGTGLGLSIVKQLVEMMGGTVSLENRPGGGSDFGFTARFGFGETTEVVTEQPVTAIRESAADVGEKTRLSVLVVEDTELNQLLVARFLEKLGHRTTVVVNGREAVEEVRRGDYDVVLMDVQMPVMDGIEAARTIRQEEVERGGRVPIIAMTAHVLGEDVTRCLEAGMDAHLPKPMTRADLERVLQPYS